MNKTLRTLWFLTILRATSGCIGPVPMEEPCHCEITPTTEILNTEATTRSPGIIQVSQGLDATGRPFQTFSLLFSNSQYQPGTDGIVLSLNNQGQLTTVWNGRLIGLGRPVQATSANLPQGCTTTTGFWEVPVGFGTIAEDLHGSRDPGFSVVGHPLREGQELEVRIDVCVGSTCIPGVTKTFRVHLVP